MKLAITKDIKWIYFISKRFARIDKNSRFALTGILPAIGIAFGVMALIVIISVMNGFQSGSIESLLEISSYHIRLTDENKGSQSSIVEQVKQIQEVKAVIPFYEAQGLIVGNQNKQGAILLRAIPKDTYELDEGFKKCVRMYKGKFDLNKENSIILGSTLARQLGVKVGSKISLLALSGGNDVELFSDDRVFIVTGVFSSTYSEINSLFGFISLDDGKRILGENVKQNYGVKITNSNHDARVIYQIQQKLPNIVCESWREFNRSFFGALKIEKNVLIMLVFLIFLVVAVNIYNGMQRMVFERKEEICILSALGGKKFSIQLVFLMRGFLIGVTGAIPGLMLGLLLSVRIDKVFILLAKVLYFFQYLFTTIFSPENIQYVSENSTYLFYAKIPAQVNFSEVLSITLFGILSAVISSWIASRKIMSFSIAEVLRDE